MTVIRRWLFVLGQRFTDRACDLPSTGRPWLDALPFTADEVAQRVFCVALGHEPIQDPNSSAPDWFCAWCQTSLRGPS